MMYINKTKGVFSGRDVRSDANIVNMVYQKGTKEIREALDEINTIREKKMDPALGLYAGPRDKKEDKRKEELEQINAIQDPWS